MYPGRWIELGCGANPNPECHVHVDIRNVPNVTDFACDFDKPLPIGDADFDGVFCRFAVEHLSWRKVRDFLKECARIVKPGGRAIFVTANLREQCKMLIEEDDAGELDDRWVCQIFGDQNYEGDEWIHNAHHCGFTPKSAAKAFQEAGFVDVMVSPLPEWKGDMVIEAGKAAAEKHDLPPAELATISQAFSAMGSVSNFAREGEAAKIDEAKASVVGIPFPHTKRFVRKDEISGALMESDNEGGPWSAVAGESVPAAPKEHPLPREQMFDRKYFNEGRFGAGYPGAGHGGGYWDFPCHETTFKRVMMRQPKSVLELGCGRGYLLKRFQDAGLPAWGIDISRHAWLTRVCDGILCWDLCSPNLTKPDEVKWPLAMLADAPQIQDKGKIDLCLSVAVLELIPEQFIPAIAAEMARTCKRGLHGVDFGGPGRENDKSKITLKNRAWWKSMLPEGHEVVDKSELEDGPIPEEAFKGDGKVRLNVGCCQTMFHHGWVNVDVLDLTEFARMHRYEFVQADVRQGLPFATGSVDRIFSAHMLEHLDADAGLSFLRECRRVVKPDGGIRIVVPDAKALTDAYAGGLLDQFDEGNGTAAACKAQAAKLWNYLGANHLAAYDAEALCQALEDAGWLPTAQAFRQSQFPDLLRTSCEMFYGYSIAVEGMPHLG